MKQFEKKVIDFVSTYGGRLLIAITAFLIGYLIIRLLSKAANKAIDRSRLDPAVRQFAKRALRGLLYTVLLIIVIEILGIPMSSVMAILASCGLALGLALQGALGNLAGGLMVLIFKPFQLGDYIKSGDSQGTVRDISVFYTTLVTTDNRKILIPNGDLMNATVINYSAEELRRADQDFKITNDIDGELVKSVLLGAVLATDGVLTEPAPFVRLTAVDNDTYIFSVRAWCPSAKYWDVYYDMIEHCSKALRDNGIDDPEDRIAVRLVKDAEN